MYSDKEFKLHNIAAKYIISEDVDIELYGNHAELSCLKELLNISKELKESLDKDASFECILDVIKRKKEKTKKFESLTGITWRL